MTKEQQIKEIEKWLTHYKVIKAGIENLKEEYKLIEDCGRGIDTSQEATSKTYKFNSEVENIAIKLCLMEKRIKHMENKINKINKALEALSDLEREIIEEKYIENKYYYQFTYKLYKSERQCKRIRKEALEKMSIAIWGELDVTAMSL